MRDRLNRPDRQVVDLDPAPDVPWKLVVEAAQLLRTLLEELDRRSFVKTPGGQGLHVVVPVRGTGGWDEAKAFSRAVAEHLVCMLPERFVATMSKQQCKGKILVDYLRNAESAALRSPCRWPGRNYLRSSVPIIVPSRISRTACSISPAIPGRTTCPVGRRSLARCWMGLNYNRPIFSL